jgi:hypothetical protein
VDPALTSPASEAEDREAFLVEETAERTAASFLATIYGQASFLSRLISSGSKLSILARPLKDGVTLAELYATGTSA